MTELTRNSLVKVQYSCCGVNSSIDEPEDIPIVPEKRMQAAQFIYAEATEENNDAIVALLRDANLPVDDLAQGERTFLLAFNEEEIAGCVAVEQYEMAGLLRSLAVRTEWKGNGVGKTLVEKAETWAAANGITHLYLLTTTAADYFPQLNWKIAERTSVPVAIAASTEFASVCPVSAVCMEKEILSSK